MRPASQHLVMTAPLGVITSPTGERAKDSNGVASPPLAVPCSSEQARITMMHADESVKSM